MNEQPLPVSTPLQAEATGYGWVHFLRRLLRHAGEDLKGKRVAVSGSGTVAVYAAQKALDEGGIVVSMSDSRGCAHFHAGGVAVSGMELTQNATRRSWSRERVDEELRETMSAIHQRCVDRGAMGGGRVDYIVGADMAGFVKVADALVAYGVT